ncbi:MAG: hypothetical protein AAGA34_11575 [Pseudomonadota bacterium]
MTLLQSDLGRLGFRLVKFAGTAVIAGTVAWLTYSAMMRLDSRPLADRSIEGLSSAIIGSLLIGFPVAFLTFQFAGRHIAAAPSNLWLITALAAVMVVLASFAIGNAYGAYWLGLPSVAAVTTYSALGWFWILKPLRKVNSQ